MRKSLGLGCNLLIGFLIVIPGDVGVGTGRLGKDNHNSQWPKRSALLFSVVIIAVETSWVNKSQTHSSWLLQAMRL